MEIGTDPFRAFGQDLIGMPGRANHSPDDRVHPALFHPMTEHISHGYSEYLRRDLDVLGFGEAFYVGNRLERILLRIPGPAPEPALGQFPGITELAPVPTASDRIPSIIGPLDFSPVHWITRQ